MNLIGLIVIREYLNKIRTKSFLIMTFLSPLIMIFIGFFIFYLKDVNADHSRDVVILDKSGFFLGVFESTSKTKFHYWKMDLEQAKSEIMKKKFYGLLYIPEGSPSDIANKISFFSEETPNISLMQLIRDKLTKTIFDMNLIKNGINSEDIEKSKVSVTLQMEKFTGEENSDINTLICYVLGFVSAYFLLMFIILYGNMIMRSVIEEKTNRIIEIIISSVKPYQLMMGKIIGTSLAGVTQFTVWLILGGFMMFLLSHAFGVSPSSTNEILQTKTGVDLVISEVLVRFFDFPIMKLVFVFLLYFIGGYLLYSSFYAAIGAAVDSETDSQQFVIPLTIPLVFSVYLGSATILDDPHGTISSVFSMIPLTSPIVMLMRIPFDVSWWEIGISLAILYGTFFIVVRLAAKIYRVGILMYGKKANYKELLRWMRSKS